MRNAKGFTLAEMLAVIGIMLVLMVAAFGVFTSFAERAGPDTAVSTVQAMLNGARDYAASNGVLAAVNFTADPANRADQGTIMRLCWQEVGAGGTVWSDVRGRTAVSLGENLYACNGLPAAMPALLAVGANPNTAQDETQVLAWKTGYEAILMGPTGVITAQAATLDTPAGQSFYAVFDPAGGLQIQDPAGNAVGRVQGGLTIVKMTHSTAGNHVSGFALYPLNSMSGTRLVFD